MNCVIVQPSYIPWRGYFHSIQKSDVVVFFDDVQYTRKSWRSRNRIKSREGTRWLTIPVHSRGYQTQATSIREIRIDWSKPWNVSHRETLHQAYRNAPFYRRYSAVLDEYYARESELLADLTIDLSRALCAELGIEGRRFYRSSELGVDGKKTERVVAILRCIGADHLVNGPTARGYTDHDLLHDNGITYEYMTYDFPTYPQLYGPYDPYLSVLDLLLMVGPEAPRYIWER